MGQTFSSRDVFALRSPDVEKWGPRQFFFFHFSLWPSGSLFFPFFWPGIFLLPDVGGPRSTLSRVSPRFTPLFIFTAGLREWQGCWAFFPAIFVTFRLTVYSFCALVNEKFSK